MSNRPHKSQAINRRQVKSKIAVPELDSPDLAAGQPQSTVVHFPVVGIVASAGGLAAFKLFFKTMPVNSGVAFVVVPHLDATHKSMMVDLLSRQTAMPVVQATDGTLLAANCVYVIPPNHVMTIEERTLRLGALPEHNESQTAIDIFLRSLATEQGERAIGIVLSGTGSHGTLGIREIKRGGGMAIAQSPESAEFDQMPISAIATGLIDFVLPPEQMAETLVKYVHHPYVNFDGTAIVPSEQTVEVLREILTLLREQTKFDFSSYRTNMLLRRTERRMGLMQITRMSEYLQVLREVPTEAQWLCKDFLIGVTTFFREPAAFSVLEKVVIPALVAKHTPESPIRVWVPGCATGEEAYSISILLFEALIAAGKSPDFHVFASDINDSAINFARQGVYSTSIANDISSDRLSHFFDLVDNAHYRVNKQLRDSIVFSRQNLISDAPFSRMDLISCRNLLIYLEPEVQQKLIPVFHWALNENGFLTLGPAETLGRELHLFDSISREWRVYRRAGPAKTTSAIMPLSGNDPKRPGTRTRASKPTRKSYQELAESIVLSEYCPATAIVNQQLEILNVTGRLADFLEFPAGEISKSLLAMARPGLRSKLRSACHRANQLQSEVTDNARVKRNGGYAYCSIVVRPIIEPGRSDGLLLVLLTDRTPNREHGVTSDSSPNSSSESDLVAESPIVDLLEHELKSAREELQDTTEKMSGANEELQSSNEELESSKEELQSLNEELNTVNCQLLEKVSELDHSNNEINSLMASTEIATLFLDNQLRLTRFTRSAIKLLNCSTSNIGRPIRDLASPLLDQGMTATCEAVLVSKQPVEHEITTPDEKCYLRRVLPFSSVDNEASGIVVTFIDLTNRKRDEAKHREKDARYREVFEHVATGISISDWDGDFEECNPAFCALVGYSEQELLEMKYISLVHPDDQESTNEMLRQLQAGQSLPIEAEKRYLRKDGQVVWVRKFTSVLLDVTGKPARVIALVTDMTPQKKAEGELQSSEKKTRLAAERLRAILNTTSDAIITFDSRGTIDSVNQATESIFGYASPETVGMNFNALMSPAFLIGHEDFIQRFSAEKFARSEGEHMEVSCQKKDGSSFPAELSVSRVDHLELFTGVLRDVSKRKAMQQHVLEIAADEQRRIGLELHDGTQQELTGLTLYANAILETINNAPRFEPAQDSNDVAAWQFSNPDYQRLKSNTKTMAQRLSEANRNVRDLAHGIMPVQVDAEGLRSALSELAEATNSESIRCCFECSGEFGVIDNTTATHLYRIAQEAINNSLRHGDASQILVSLDQRGNRITLKVDDDGVGFDRAHADRGGSIAGGMGLQTMKYRANLIGGSLDIRNKAEGGTLVKCLLLKEVIRNG
jgi:two-component system, chemotaxis family, CheB/CheR fusion protein